MIQLLNSGFRSAMRGLESDYGGAVSLVISDPPYENKYSDLWEPFAELSSRLLHEGGSLVTLLGHYQVPFVVEEFSSHLRYWWIGWLKHKNLNRLPGKWVCVNGKPFLWYVKGRRKKKDYECPLDTIDPSAKDWVESKKAHKWGQPIEWFEHYIERLTDEGDLVLDPFMGGGTAGVACKKLNRNFIGIDIDPNCIESATKRINDYGGGIDGKQRNGGIARPQR